MSWEEDLPEETPAVPEEEPAEEAPEAAEEDAPAAAPDSPEESEPAPAPDAPEPSPKPRPVRMSHPLWRGWWLAVCVLGIAVLMGNIDAFGVAWRRQPWRAFGGAVAAGGFLAALPGFIRRDLPERPRLRRCLLALFVGLIWGVLG